MRGSVYHFDEDQDYGYVNGVDGKRYLFTRDDLSHGVVLARGTVVEFQPDDGAAHDIVASTTLPLGVDRPTQSGRIAADQPALGLWAYFRRALIADFINFNGRARRKEFWAFYLCSFVVLVALSGFGVLLNLAISGFGNGPRTSSDLFQPCCSCSQSMCRSSPFSCVACTTSASADGSRCFASHRLSTPSPSSFSE